MRIPIASDGYRFIIPLFIITVALALSPLIWLAGVSGLLLLFVCMQKLIAWISLRAAERFRRVA